jgi:hypothetical protein
MMMKRFVASALALLFLGTAAWAVSEGTKTPVVNPPESGENSLSQGEIFNMARLKIGMGTVTSAVSASAASGTLNSAAGAWTLTAATAGASGATPTTATLTNSKVGANDIVVCEIDQTGATAGSVLSCNPHVTAGTITFKIYSATPTALTSSTIILYYVVLTSGNPN